MPSCSPFRWDCSARCSRSALRGYAYDLYTQIGIVTLIGLAAKNAILIVEFAKLRREEGVSIAAAAAEAAQLRFRPILMTSFAFLLGVLPLVVATGPAPPRGARSARRSSAAWRRPRCSASSSSRSCTSSSSGSPIAGPNRGRPRSSPVGATEVLP